MLRLSYLVVAILMAVSLNAGVVQEQVTPALTPATFQFAFQLSGFDLSAGQALDIEFDPAVYLALSDGSAPAGFNVTLLQPNNPQGTTGDFIVEENSGATASSAGIFSLDAALNAAGQPGSLPFFLYTVDSAGMFEDLIQSGATTLVTGALITPEPLSFWFAGFSLFAVGMSRRLAARP